MPDSSSPPYDALLLVSFGGPEGPDDVLPFLENVVRGKNVPQQRLLEVAEHYELFGGISPINSQNRALLSALVAELQAHDLQLPVYWGNRNWHPMLVDAVTQMADDGIRCALAFATSPFGSYSGCRQYIEDIEHARRAVGPEAPQIDKLRLFYNHPGFIEATAERVAAALAELPAERRNAAEVIFAAHSIPVDMAARCPYEGQLQEACRLVIEVLRQRVEGGSGKVERWRLAYQSRSGPPSQPWLEPDVRDLVQQLHSASGVEDIVIVPIGFLSENLEILYDLDVELHEFCEELGVNMVRAAVVGSHPRFVGMIRELVQERLDPTTPKLALGLQNPAPDCCPADCCAKPI